MTVRNLQQEKNIFIAGEYYERATIMACARRPVHINKAARSWSADRSWSAEDKSRLDRFHSQFAGGPTKLVRLADELAAEIGVKAIFIKDESTRFGLSSFKILGASWATFRALASELGLPSDAGLDALKTALESRPLTLYAATAGNHGRAVAHMASLLGIASEIHVPFGMHAPTIRGLQDEGAKVLVNAGTYDDAMHAAEAAAKLGDGLLVQDCSFDGYTKIPKVNENLPSLQTRAQNQSLTVNSFSGLLKATGA